MIEQKEGKKVYYICECGREFDNPQSFNGHKAHCKIHLAACSKLDAYIERMTNFIKIGQLASSEKAKLQKQLSAEKWISEEHHCEKCGKLMLEKYGSGRFCCKSCANSHKKSEETKTKISQTLRLKPKAVRNQRDASELYNANPKLCQICGKPLPYNKRYNKTCSQTCKKMYLSRKLKHTFDNIGKEVYGRHIVYKIVNDIDSRYYIGVRKVENDSIDQYLGSGIHIKNMIKYYGKEHFKRITLFEFNNSSEAFAKERELLDVALKDPLCVNLAPGGKGGATFKGRHHSEKTKELLRQKHVNSMLNPEIKALVVKKNCDRCLGKPNANKGKIYINNFSNQLLIYPTDFIIYEQQGYIKGKLKKK